jgi:hypothetical protein
MAAFFTQMRGDNATKKDAKSGTIPGVHEGPQGKLPKGAASEKPAPVGSITIPDTKGQTVKARFLLGTEPNLSGKTQLRPAFVTWATAPGNPFFARAAVNRWWANFFGRGLVNPIDDMRPDNAATHPQLLDLLAREFSASGFDLKHLIRCICNSQTYQRTSAPVKGNKDDNELYSHAAVRMMTADQLYDSLEVALSHAPAAKVKGGPKAAGGGGAREQFRRFFHTEADDDATAVADYAHGIPQVLRLMNSAQMNDNTAVIARLMKNEGTPEKIIEALYLRILSRLPREAETKRMAAHVKSAKDPAQGYSDVMWVLVNSSEFMFNH